jgi:hypothetical protein
MEEEEEERREGREKEEYGTGGTLLWCAYPIRLRH